MTEEQKAAVVMARCASAFCDALGLIADNMKARSEGKPPMYGRAAFKDIVVQNGLDHDTVMKFFRGGQS